MAEITKIQWCDQTFNPWRGCTRVSEGCRHCYAEKMSSRNPNVLGVWGPQGTRPLGTESYWRQPSAWNRKAAREGVRRRVFCCSLADVFEDWPGQMTDGNGCPLWLEDPFAPPTASHQKPQGSLPYTLDFARARLWRLVEATTHLDWLLLTKRPENMARMVPEAWASFWPVNVWAMTSVEDQENADRRVPELLKVPALVRGLSVEPLLGPVNLCKVYGRNRSSLYDLHWVIIGGESGQHARPCHLEWVRELVRQCRLTGVAVFVKQLGSRPNGMGYQTLMPYAITDPKGGDIAEFPEDLRVREFPHAH